MMGVLSSGGSLIGGMVLVVEFGFSEYASRNGWLEWQSRSLLLIISTKAEPFLTLLVILHTFEWECSWFIFTSSFPNHQVSWTFFWTHCSHVGFLVSMFQYWSLWNYFMTGGLDRQISILYYVYVHCTVWVRWERAIGVCLLTSRGNFSAKYQKLQKVLTSGKDESGKEEEGGEGGTSSGDTFPHCWRRLLPLAC